MDTATAAQWPDNLNVAVNISAVQFRNPGLMQWLAEANGAGRRVAAGQRAGGRVWLGGPRTGARLWRVGSNLSRSSRRRFLTPSSR